MVLYTPLAEADIFPQESNIYKIGQYKGKEVIVQEYEGEMHLVQLMSTNPQDFLDASFSPGAVVPKDVIQDR